MLSGKSKNPSDRKRIIRYLAAVVILGFAVYYFLPRIATLENSLKVLRSMSVWLVLLAAAAEALSYVGSGYLLKAIMHLGKSRFTVFRGVLITLAAASIGLVMGGWVTMAATTYYWASKEGASPEGSKLTGFLPTLYNDALMTLLTGVGLLHLLIVHDLSAAQMVLYGTIFFLWVLALLVVVYGMRRPKQIESIAQKVFDGFRHLFKRTKETTAVHDTVNDVYTGLMLLKGRGWIRPAAGACINLGCDMLVLYLLFIASGHAVEPVVLVTGYSIAFILKTISFFVPGGIGVVESGMAAVFTSLGVPAGTSVVVVLGYRLLSFWLPSILGFAANAWLVRTARRNGK